MKAILEFNLPEDEVDFKRCVKALDMYLALWRLAQITVTHPGIKAEEFDTVMQDLSINFDELGG